MDSIYSVAVSLFFVLDPLGNVPLVIAMLKGYAPRRRQWIILRESLIALCAMVAFLFFGPAILTYMGIGEPSMGMTGGVILFLIGLRMSFPSHEDENDTFSGSKEPLIVPLAIPLIAGPGVLGMVMLTAKRSQNVLESLGALFAAWLACTLILLFSSLLARIMGQRGMEASQRLMGLALTAMAVNMFMTGFKTFMKS